eukprot:tig00000443_g785.t1
MTSNWYQTLNSLDAGNNNSNFARIPSGSYVDVFLQNPVVIQAVQNAYATPKIYSYQLFFDPSTLSAEVIELLHESGLVKRVAPATATANVLRCLEVKFRETGYGPTVNQYTDTALPGTGAFTARGTLKGDVLFTKFNPSPATLGALYTGGNPRASGLPRFPFTFFKFQVFPCPTPPTSPLQHGRQPLRGAARVLDFLQAHHRLRRRAARGPPLGIGNDIALFYG